LPYTANPREIRALAIGGTVLTQQIRTTRRRDQPEPIGLPEGSQMSETGFPQWKVGDVTVTKILESECEGILADHRSGDAQALSRIEWLKPKFVTGQGIMKWSIRAPVVQTPTQRIIVDTCIGNDKSMDVAADRPGASLSAGYDDIRHQS
jgi:hypothetical protein